MTGGQEGSNSTLSRAAKTNGVRWWLLPCGRIQKIGRPRSRAGMEGGPGGDALRMHVALTSEHLTEIVPMIRVGFEQFSARIRHEASHRTGNGRPSRKHNPYQTLVRNRYDTTRK